jgi:hypothetical protein
MGGFAGSWEVALGGICYDLTDGWWLGGRKDGRRLMLLGVSKWDVCYAIVIGNN